MRQPLGQHLHPGFGDVIGGIAWRAGDPLFGAGIDDRAWRALVDHRLDKGLDAVDHSPKVDAQPALPAFVMIPGTAARRDAGVVHQYSNLAERVVSAVLQPPYLVQLADVGRHCNEVRRAPFATWATSAAALSSASPPRSAAQTRMPIAANRLAAAKPMPLAAPVMTATRPSVSAGC